MQFPQYDAPPPRREFRTETAAPPHAVAFYTPPGSAGGSVRLPPQPPLLPAQTAHRALSECPHTTPAPLSGLRPLPLSRRPAASLFLRQACPDLLPRNHSGGILLIPRHPVVQFRPLRVRQRCVVFQALPQHVKKLELFRSGEAPDLIPKIAHLSINLSAVSPHGQGVVPESRHYRQGAFRNPR